MRFIRVDVCGACPSQRRLCTSLIMDDGSSPVPVNNSATGQNFTGLVIAVYVVDRVLWNGACFNGRTFCAAMEQMLLCIQRTKGPAA
jgi:hypothetical protein